MTKSPYPTPSKLQRIVAMGIFDGVHLGHQKLLQTMQQRALATNARSCVVSFHPHPATLLAPERAPRLLQPVSERLATLKSYGADEIECLKFTPEVAQMSFEAFIDDILCKKLNVCHVVVGDDFAFGKGRKGVPERFKKAAIERGFDVTFVGAIAGFDGQRVSSTRIRQAVAEGDVALAQKLLGRPYKLCGRVDSQAMVLRRDPNFIWPCAGIYEAALNAQTCTIEVTEKSAKPLAPAEARIFEQSASVTLSRLISQTNTRRH